AELSEGHWEHPTRQGRRQPCRGNLVRGISVEHLAEVRDGGGSLPASEEFLGSSNLHFVQSFLSQQTLFVRLRDLPLQLLISFGLFVPRGEGPPLGLARHDSKPRSGCHAAD